MLTQFFNVYLINLKNKGYDKNRAIKQNNSRFTTNTTR
jgi:hypothetical protein